MRLPMAKLQWFSLFTPLIQLLFIHFGSATPLTSPLQDTITNTAPNSLPICIDTPNWVPTKVKYSECLSALEVFRRTEGAKSGSQRFEFLAPGAKRTTTLLPLTTPRKYHVGTCTITIAMLAAFPFQYLPRAAKLKTYAPADVATLDQLRGAAGSVVRDCVLPGRGWPHVGWIPQGVAPNEGIAVSVWETGSFMDRVINGNSYLSTNGSADGTSIA